MDAAAQGDSRQKAREHYDSDQADAFYHRVWAGDDVSIGIGIYGDADDTIFAACQRTVAKMASLLPHRGRDTRVLDLGAGYGATARYLAGHLGFRVDCLNLSTVQNAYNRRRNGAQGLEARIRVIDGDFNALPELTGGYDVAWSQDAFVHSHDRRQVLQGVQRVLKPGGDVLFTDILQREGCPQEALGPVLARFHLAHLGSFRVYREVARALGWREVLVSDLSPHLGAHYRRVLQEWQAKYQDVVGALGAAYLDAVRQGIGRWIAASERGDLQWGMFHFRKP